MPARKMPSATRRSTRSGSKTANSDTPASSKDNRETAIDEILRNLDPYNDDRAYVPGLLYVVNAATWNNSDWYSYVVKRAKDLGFNAVGRYEIAPRLSMSELNVTHLLIARADAILFDLTEMTPATGYQVGFAFAIGNLSADVAVMKNSTYLDALQILCPYNITAYSDKTFPQTLDDEFRRLIRTRPHLQKSKAKRNTPAQRRPSSRILR